jgi:hypothetical protein
MTNSLQSEREAAEKWLLNLMGEYDFTLPTKAFPRIVDGLVEAIASRAPSPAPEGAAEPIGEIRADTLNVFYDGILPPVGTKLYASPQLPVESSEPSCPECSGALQWRCPTCQISDSPDTYRALAAVPLTDEQIIAIRDEHLPNQGESFDCIGFARAILAAAAPPAPEAGEPLKCKGCGRTIAEHTPLLHCHPATPPERPGIPQGWTLTQGKGAFSKDRWVCVRNDESQCGQEFWEIDNPLIYAFLAALAAQEGKTE